MTAWVPGVIVKLVSVLINVSLEKYTVIFHMTLLNISNIEFNIRTHNNTEILVNKTFILIIVMPLLMT